MPDDVRRQESDLGQEQRRRVEEEGQDFQPSAPEPVPELGGEESAQRMDIVDDPDEPVEKVDEDADPELAEDLARAQPNPPMAAPGEADPTSDVDLGYMEDQERETAWELDTMSQPQPAEPTDPLYEERERRDAPGDETEQLPDEVGNRPPQLRHRDRHEERGDA